MQIQGNGRIRSSSLNFKKATGETSKGAVGATQADSFTPSAATGNEPSFINPGSIVVVGGSEKPGPGNTLMENLLLILHLKTGDLKNHQLGWLVMILIRT